MTNVLNEIRSRLVQGPCISASQYVAPPYAHGIGSAHEVEGEEDAEGAARVAGM